MRLTAEMETYLRESQKELKTLIRQLCAIPAPSGHEEKRAEFCLNWFHQNGGRDAFIDEALNVVCPVDVTEKQDVSVFMAHMDTVFPDMKPMPQEEHGGRLYCPGVCDDTASLAVMMICARYFLKRPIKPRHGIVFVGNACEEGLGNLKGCRAICKRYSSVMREFVTLDDPKLNDLINDTVGSHRYRVTVRTEGGHSYAAFGNRNAIHCLASMITRLYEVEVPHHGDSITTYNVGLISGGTSVNTIAQEASMLYEYRSSKKICMDEMQKIFEGIIETYRKTGIDITVEKIGDRPCSGAVDPIRQQALTDRGAAVIREILHLEPHIIAGSTDCNIPLSMGIPSICLSVCAGKGCHTREEFLELDSLLPGSRLFLSFLSDCYEL